MIAHAIFYDRLERYCKSCPFWRSVCLKGHSLASPEGCPLHKFPPVQGAGYAEEKVVAQVPVVVPGCCGGSEMPTMSWPQVIAHFGQAMLKWVREGLPVVGSAEHGARYDQCKTCDQFRNFYCNQCKCVAFVMAKLTTSECPKQRWSRPATSTVPGA